MPKLSAGILLYRQGAAGLEVLLVHPGGPFWSKKDAGVWSVPKGEYGKDEEPLAAAQREFAEETGFQLSEAVARPLGEARLPSGKVVSVWAMEGDCDAEAAHSNTFPMEWPPKSGKVQEFPEVDRAAWFTLDEAREKLYPQQQVFLDRLAGLAQSGK